MKRNYSKLIISGLVTEGLGIGKKFGLPPTMNLRVRRIPKTLRHGIYAVFVKTPVGEFPGVLHFGLRPAVHAPLSFEVHCFGLKKKMYGKRVSVEIVKRIRAVKNFATIAALKKAIEGDVKEAKRILKIGHLIIGHLL